MKKLSTISSLSALCLLSLFTLHSSLFGAPTSGIAPAIDRSTIAAIDTIIYKTGAADIVTIEATLPAGNYYNPANNCAIATLTAAMLDQGTAKRDKYAIAAALESVGATLSFDADNINASISGKCLTKDIPLLISLIAEQLRTPAFDAGEFDKVKSQLIGSLQRASDNTDARAARAFYGTIYTPDHPNYRSSIEDTIKAVNAATLDDVKKFHAAHYGPANLTLVAVGDIDAPALKTAIAQNFTNWPATVAKKITQPAPAKAPEKIDVFMAEKTSISIIWGQPVTLKYTDPDYPALATATAILGEGFTGRLLANVRDREGLTYGIGARTTNNTYTAGDFRIVATFAPALLEKGIASTRRQLEEWYTKGVTAQELADRKTNLIGAYKVSLATTEGMAAAILATIQRGQPLTALDEYPSKIDALTLSDVNAAIKKYLNPARMTLVQAGTIK